MQSRRSPRYAEENFGFTHNQETLEKKLEVKRQLRKC